jgi:hypothetical protein
MKRGGDGGWEIVFGPDRSVVARRKENGKGDPEAEGAADELWGRKRKAIRLAKSFT